VARYFTNGKEAVRTDDDAPVSGVCLEWLRGYDLRLWKEMIVVVFCAIAIAAQGPRLLTSDTPISENDSSSYSSAQGRRALFLSAYGVKSVMLCLALRLKDDTSVVRR